jgi:peptide/nickel transport system substrate-binding protein
MPNAGSATDWKEQLMSVSGLGALAGRIGRVAVALSLAFVVSIAIAACGSSSSETGGGSGGSATAGGDAGGGEELLTTTPAASGQVPKIVWALSAGEPITLDPQKSGDYSPKTVEANLCDPVMQIQPDGSVAPGLAEKATMPNPTTVVLAIRKGVKFWDGKELTAEDVAFSLNRNLDPALEANYASEFSDVASIKATDDHTVTIKLHKPRPSFVDNLVTSGAGVSEKAYVESAGKEYGTAKGGLMCTGPFEFDSWTSGQSIVIKRNPGYWNPKLEPKVGVVEFKFIGENNTLTSALLSGAVDGSYEVSTSSIDALSGSSSGTLYRGKSTIGVLLGPTKTSGPGADPLFREALNLAIDKTAITSLAAGGAGEPMRGMVPKFVWAGIPAQPIYEKGYEALPSAEETNDELAEQKIAEMKEPPSGPVTLAIIAGNQLMLKAATLVQADAKAIGVDIKIEQLQPSVYTSIYFDPSVRDKYDLFASSGAFVEAPNPLVWAPNFVLPEGPFNYAAYEDPTVTKNIEAAFEAEEEESAKLFVAAQKIYEENGGPIIPLTTIDELLYMNDKISGAPASSSYLDYPWAAAIGGTE